MPNDVLRGKILNEGYCCINGYLRLCKARGENATAMAKNLNISPAIVQYHFRAYKKKSGAL